MEATSFYGLSIFLRCSEQVGQVIAAHDGLLWSGKKRTVTYHFLVSLRQLLLPPSRRHQRLKLMATRRHLMAVDATTSLRIASNSIEVEVYKLVVSNFKYQ